MQMMSVHVLRKGPVYWCREQYTYTFSMPQSRFQRRCIPQDESPASTAWLLLAAQELGVSKEDRPQSDEHVAKKHVLALEVICSQLEISTAWRHIVMALGRPARGSCGLDPSEGAVRKLQACQIQLED